MSEFDWLLETLLQTLNRMRMLSILWLNGLQMYHLTVFFVKNENENENFGSETRRQLGLLKEVKRKNKSFLKSCVKYDKTPSKYRLNLPWKDGCFL